MDQERNEDTQGNEAESKERETKRKRTRIRKRRSRTKMERLGREVDNETDDAVVDAHDGGGA